MRIEQTNSEILRIRITPDMKEFIEIFSREMGTDVSKVIRALINNLKHEKELKG